MTTDEYKQDLLKRNQEVATSLTFLSQLVIVTVWEVRQMNQLHNFREDFLDEIELALVEVRRAQPDTRAVFRSQSVPLEKLISEFGDVLEEEILTVPRYQMMSSVIVIQKGRAPG